MVADKSDTPINRIGETHLWGEVVGRRVDSIEGKKAESCLGMYSLPFDPFARGFARGEGESLPPRIFARGGGISPPVEWRLPRMLIFARD